MRQPLVHTAWLQVVDASISESVFNMLESCVTEMASAGYDRPPSGSTISGEMAFRQYHFLGDMFWKYDLG
jgi:hypothetical protein